MLTDHDWTSNMNPTPRPEPAPRCARVPAARPALRLLPALLLPALLLPACSSPQSRIYRYETPGGAAAAQEEVDPEAAQAEYTSGWSDLNDGRLDAALVHFTRAAALDPTNGRAKNNAGWIHYRQGRTFEAAHAFKRAIELLPGEPAPLSNLGLAMEDAGRLDEAIRLHEAAASVAPDRSLYTARATKAKLERGDDVEALRETLEALAWSAEDAQWSGWAERQLAAHPSGSTPDGAPIGSAPLGPDSGFVEEFDETFDAAR